MFILVSRFTLEEEANENIPLPIFKNEPNGRNKAYTSNLAPRMILEGEDYGLKAGINDLHNAGQQSGRVRP